MNIADDLANAYDEGYRQGRESGIKEFARRLSDRISDSIERSLDNPEGQNYFLTDVYKDIDNLVKEMAVG